ncbi:MAG: beta-propeller domain-containing protein [Spirochaetaceae bacterium]|nr:beta-propeller domain-containing protein [Spirochaetaceae bacterium]
MQNNKFTGFFPIFLGLLSLFFMGCDLISSGGGNTAVDDYGLSSSINISEKGRLSAFDSEILQSYDDLQELADDIDSMAVSFATQIIQSDSFPYNYYYGYGWDVMAVDDVMETTDNSGSDSEAPSGSYETNNQVSGVEEVDILQSNGNYSFLASGGEVLSFSYQGELIDRLTLFEDSTISGLLLFENKLLAIKQTTYGYWLCDCIGAGYEENNPVTELVLLNIGAQGQLSIAGSKSLKGSYMSARMANGQVYLTSSQDFSIYDLIYTISDQLNNYPDLTLEQQRERALELLETEVPKWRNQMISALFSDENNLDVQAIQNTIKMFDLADGAEAQDVIPFSSSYNSFLNLYSFNISSGFADLTRQGSFSTANSWNSTMYSDGEYVVIANEGWTMSDTSWEENVFLTVYLNQSGQINPVALGKVQGHTLNQFSMDIYQDKLRIATSQWGRWGWNGSDWGEESQSESFVSILDIQSPGSVMNTIGFLDNLGLGETLFAVRFMKEKGFMVTFLQVDPFYTLDLSVPSNPRKVGELVIPGFSRYLQPISDDYILGIGQDNGLQVALFDISSMAAPVQLQKYVYSDSSYSNAEYDHHAFRYVASEEILIIPQYAWGYDGDNKFGFSVLEISPTLGIEERGFISYPDSPYSESWINSPRSMLIEDTVITMMHNKIQGHDITDLSYQWDIDL